MTFGGTPAAGEFGACPNCGNESLRLAYTDEVFDHADDGAATVTVRATNVPVEVCDRCGKSFVTKETLRVRHESVCRSLGLLTPAEIKAIRERHRLSQAEFAEITGLGEASISRWERGRLLPNRGNNAYLRSLRQNPELVAQLRREFCESQRESSSRLGSQGSARFRSLPAAEVRRHQVRARSFNLIAV